MYEYAEAFINFGIAIGICIGFFVGGLLVCGLIAISNNQHKQRMRRSYREMNDKTKEQTDNILENIAEDFIKLYETTHVHDFKQTVNDIAELSTYIQKYNTLK